MANLPGQNVTDNLPPLPNVTPDPVRASVPVEWDDFKLVTDAVFEVLRTKGKDAADALLAECKRLRAS